MPTAVVDKIKERDQLRQDQPESPQLAELNKEIDKGINDHKREKWRSTVSDINSKTNSAQLFKLIKHLNGNAKASANQSIKFKGK